MQSEKIRRYSSYSDATALQVPVEEQLPQKQTGVWIDHRKAIIVSVTDEGEEMGLVISASGKQMRRSGDSPLKGTYESLRVPADDVRQKIVTAHLKLYYEAVTASIGDADSIMIFGPGEAKGELRKHLEKKKPGGRIVSVETIDKMTDRQVAAKVRGHFAAKPKAARTRRSPPARSADARRQLRGTSARR